MCGNLPSGQTTHQRLRVLIGGLALFIYLFILSYGMEPMGYGLKMRKKARKEKQQQRQRKLENTHKKAKLLPSLSPRLSAPQHYRLLSRQI
jgi:hypothetical protein